MGVNVHGFEHVSRNNLRYFEMHVYDITYLLSRGRSRISSICTTCDEFSASSPIPQGRFMLNIMKIQPFFLVFFLFFSLRRPLI